MRRIAVIGLGNVGWPVALAFARRFPGSLGFDRDRDKVARLRRGELPPGMQADPRAVEPGGLGGIGETDLRITDQPEELSGCDFFIVAVPTPIDDARRPDLEPLEDAARTVGAALSAGAICVVESTVYPGATEEVFAPILEEVSGLESGVDFKLGYSPERIDPGAAEHSFERVRKVIAAQDAETLAVMRACYGAVVEAGLHEAPSIRVAEAAKVIENVQRDLNIALVNELAMLFERLDLDTTAVLEAAGTKWNFHAFRPGLVGGHCIGVDPYYLTAKAEAVGFHPDLILAGRRTNDGMGAYVVERTVRLLIAAGRNVGEARVAVLGLAYKPNVVDIRNSRVPDVIAGLREYGAEVLVHDPLVDAASARRLYGIELVAGDALETLDAIVLATPHHVLVPVALELARRGAALLVDPLWGVDPSLVPADVTYWRL